MTTTNPTSKSLTIRYTWTNEKGNNLVEEFNSRGYQTLTRNGLHVYEHQHSKFGLNYQMHQLEVFLNRKGLEFKKENV